jgi:hypothetical protein
MEIVMVTYKELKVQQIMQDDQLTREQKIDALREIETEARALQRTASESPMNDNDGWETDLREVRLALEKLGADDQRKGAATL